MHKYLRLKRIKLNDKRTEAACRLAEGDKVQLYINDEYFEQVREEEAFRRIKTPRLTVVYEDENILLADKAPGMVVHADENGDSDTLIAHIQAYLYQSGAWNPDDAASFAPALCNRIDDRPVPGAKTAKTLYRTLASTKELSLVECTLLTGRTHQIRAHMASIGCPLLGDGKYGRGDRNRACGETGQLLYSFELTFAFESDAGALQYLNGKTFRVKDIAFVKKYFPNYRF